MNEKHDDKHLYKIIKVSRDQDLMEQIGRSIYFDLVDHDKVHTFRIHKQMRFHQFKKEVAKEFGIPVQFQRFWLWAKRQNYTVRPLRPLTLLEESYPVCHREFSKASSPELRLFLEVELGLDLQPVLPPKKNEEDILLFFKLYDPMKERLRYVGRLFVWQGGKPAEILAKLKEMAGFNANEEIELFEEIKFKPRVMCESIDKEATFAVSEIGNGDIICFQQSQVEITEQCRHPDIPSFLEYVYSRQESNVAEAKEVSSSFAEIDGLFTDIQNLLEGKTSEAQTSIGSFSCLYNAGEIANAKRFFKQCLDMELSDVVQSEQRTQLKNSLATMIASNAFPGNMVDVALKFLADFDQSIEQFVAAQKDLREAEEKEKSIGELKTILKQLSVKFTPKRDEAEAVDREIAELERQLIERKEKKAWLMNSLQDLAGQATTSKQALVTAKQDMKLLIIKKERAEKTVGELERSWESLKVGCSPLLP